MPALSTLLALLLPPTAMAADAPGWITCADEGQHCSFTGLRVVRYGIGAPTAPGGAERLLHDGTPCTNTVFGDPAYGWRKTCWVATTAAPGWADAAPAGPAAAGVDAPVVFNASAAAQAGDVVFLQGERFGSAPVVTLDGAPQQPLPIVHRVGGGWLAVQLPADAAGALTARVRNATGISAPVTFNAAQPWHLDATELAPGGALRVVGRNLQVPGSTPRVTVNGQPAQLDAQRSGATLLQAWAPRALVPGAAAVVTVDNGNGSGAARLERPATVATAVAPAHAGEPFGAGVGWAQAFAPIAARRLLAAGDARLARRVACDGRSDDTAALQAALDVAAAMGGATVVLPAGRCRLAGSLALRSRVVLQGQGKTATELAYEADYPVHGIGLDRVGLRDLMLTNAGGAQEGPLLKNSTRVLLQRLAVRLQTSRQMYLSDNRDIVIADTDVQQTGSISHQGPYTLDGSRGLVFQRNNTRWVDGAPTFSRVHDSVLLANRFTRDAARQDDGGTVHSLVLDFAHRIAVVGNAFDVAHGPIAQARRNDGETLLTEGGGGQRTEAVGTVLRAGPDSLTSTTRLQADPFGQGALPENYGVAIVAGRGAGQTRRIVAYAWPTLRVDRPWDVVPDAGSRFAAFVWGLERATLQGNQLVQNPRGIWLYHTAVRDVAVLDNDIREGGGIYLRAFQSLATHSFMPLYNVLVARNRITNTQRQGLSYLHAVFVNTDTRAWGSAFIGLEVRDNVLVANRPNLSSGSEEYAGAEGFMAMMRMESSGPYEGAAAPPLLGAIFSRNACRQCDVGLRLGTGAVGTTVLDAARLEAAEPVTDWATGGGAERSTDTLIR